MPLVCQQCSATTFRLPLRERLSCSIKTIFNVPTTIGLQFGCYFIHFIDFEDIPGLYVVKILQTDTAFIAGQHFFSVFFKTTQRSNFTVENDDVVSKKPDFGLSVDLAIRYLAPGSCVDLGDLEDLLMLACPMTLSCRTGSRSPDMASLTSLMAL